MLPIAHKAKREELMAQQPEPPSNPGIGFSPPEPEEVAKPKQEPPARKSDSPPISGQQVYGLQDDPM